MGRRGASGGRDVVVTGVGAVTPVGETAELTWDALLAGESGVGRIQQFDPTEYDLRATTACEIDAPLDPPEGVDDRSAGRAATVGLLAALEAVDDAGFDSDDPDWTPDRVATSVGCALGGVPEMERQIRSGGRPDPRFLLSYLSSLIGGHLSRLVDARGQARTSAGACAAGAHAIADAVDDIRLGRADVAVAGGAEAAISPTSVGGFGAMRALSARTENPAAASRPFDADRDGFVLGEGAGMLVLETRERARKRGAPVYAEVTGTSLSADAHHPTRPAEGGTGLKRAVERALADANRRPAAIDHVNAHGTSTQAGDAAEAAALNAVFEGCPPVTSVKGQLGHALGAAPAIEAVVVAKTLATGRLPPTRNYATPDSDCDLPVVADPTYADPETVVSTAAGFGGTNAALVFERGSER